MKNEEIVFLHALNLVPWLGPVNLLKLIKLFGGAENIWKNFLKTDVSIPDKLKSSISEYITKTDPIKCFDKIPHYIKLCSYYDKNYSPLLKQIYAPPLILYYRGDISILLTKRIIGVVGTRKASSYGKKVCRELITELAQNNIAITSGMAMGIDTIAHESCIQTGGKTIAVLGGGIDEASIHPRCNMRLAHNIIEKGLMISEFPPFTEASKFNFPRRNRIISGVSRGVMVAEAPEKSGALITANFALEQNRDVFAIPGDISRESSMGCNNLIKQGAILASSYKDVCINYGWNMKCQNSTFIEQNLDKEEKLVLNILEESEMYFDEIQIRSKLDTKKLSSKLTGMEIKGLVKKEANGKFQIQI